MTTYVSIVGADQIGDASHDDLVQFCASLEGWMTDHEGDDVDVYVRPPRRGEVCGLYRLRGGIPDGRMVRRGDGEEEARVIDLLDEAWEQYCRGAL